MGFMAMVPSWFGRDGSLLRSRIAFAGGARAARGCNAARGQRLQRNRGGGCGVGPGQDRWEVAMRGGLLWLLGIPIPIIILLYLFGVL